MIALTPRHTRGPVPARRLLVCASREEASIEARDHRDRGRTCEVLERQIRAGGALADVYIVVVRDGE